MKGCSELIDMRLRGVKPPIVRVDLDIDHPAGEGAIRVHDSDPLYSLDLRGVQGLVVTVSGCDGKRVKAVAQACIEAGAGRVIANISERMPYGFRVVEVEDTKGVFSWKQ